MDEKAFQEKLSQLMEKINELPLADRRPLEQLADDARQRRERIKLSISELQESLDYLRLSVKYLVFDLEATRRENSYLRKLVEQSSPNDKPKKRKNSSPDNFMEGDDAPGR